MAEFSPGAPAVAETHISWVFFTDDRAYKLLKPITMPFLDYSIREHRIEAAKRELELNRRMAPDVYLGLADVVEHDQLVDRMIVMRRLPEDRRLSNLVGDERFEAELRSTTKAIAAFHAGQDPVHDAPMATAAAMRSNWEGNFAAIEPHVGALIDSADHERVEALAMGYLEARDALFAARMAGGFVRDGHGDLLADDIYCLDDGPRIIDCLAFDDDLRIADVLADIGFLIMDIHRLAGPEIAHEVMHWYGQYTYEHHPPSLAHHYVAYRAHVRTKIACLREEQGDGDSADLARTYHHLTLHHLERARIRLIVIGGGPGVGKSTLATGLGDHFGYPVLPTDEIRKDLTGTPHDEHRFEKPGEGIYGPETTERTYAEQRREARLLLDAGYGVILDASFPHKEERAAARALAADCGAELVEIECTLDPSIAKARITNRLSTSRTPSDARPELVDQLAGIRDPWPEALSISTKTSPAGVVAAITAAIERAAPHRI